MEEKKTNKLDLIFIIGEAIIGLGGAFIDVYQRVVNFPVYSIISIYVSYAFLVLLLILSATKFKDAEKKPSLVRWYMILLLPYLHIFFVAIGLICWRLILPLFW